MLKMPKVGIQGTGVAISHLKVDVDSVVDARIDLLDRQTWKDRVKKGWFLGKNAVKSIAGYDVDPTTFATEAAENAVKMARIDPYYIRAVTVGSESKPYSVGTMARHVASFVGAGEEVFVSDLEGACNSGMQGVAFIEPMIETGKIPYGLAVGSDISQANI